MEIEKLKTILFCGLIGSVLLFEFILIVGAFLSGFVAGLMTLSICGFLTFGISYLIIKDEY